MYLLVDSEGYVHSIHSSLQDAQLDLAKVHDCHLEELHGSTCPFLLESSCRVTGQEIIFPENCSKGCSLYKQARKGLVPLSP